VGKEAGYPDPDGMFLAFEWNFDYVACTGDFSDKASLPTPKSADKTPLTTGEGYKIALYADSKWTVLDQTFTFK
jgi:hypothetical protein